ncbi:MAG: response regulator transcription factor [Bryobacterales bacterium]|nr:response regulator transcription factor [Bryobacterales bacterium]
MSRILIVEDEPAMLRGLKDNFAANGHEVIVAMDGQSGMEKALSAEPDLIVLDLMLPKVNGYEICRAVRERELNMPILMLTAKSQEEDVVLGLNLGADDYVTKPFRIRELLARVHALLRRRQTPAEGTIRFGECELDLEAHRFQRNGVEVELTAKEFGLLRYLASHPGRAFTREQILNHVWGNSVIVTGRSVDRCVATLRSKIEADPGKPVFIETVRDVGYRFDFGE